VGIRRDLYPSQARTATPTPVEVVEDFDGVRIVIDVTAIGPAPSVTFNVEGHAPLSDKWFSLLASAAITGVGTTVLTVFPGAAVTTNVSANNLMGGHWRVRPVHANADSITYSVGVELLNV
jgi:hypothetical protein